MSFHFSAQWIEDYRRDGYVILPEVVPPSLIADLRQVSEQGRKLARATGGPMAQRFEPVANWDIDQKPFDDYRELPELRDAICRLLSPRHTYGNRELHLGVLIEPVDVPYCMPWHQDLRHLAVSSLPFLTPDAKRDPDLFNQINFALYQDDSLWVVPGSHARDDTAEERAAFPHGEPTAPSFESQSNEERERTCLAYCRRMPGAVNVHLDPGDVCVYRGTIWHMGNYVPYVKRATIIDLIDTPAYAEFRTRAGLDKELADRTTTRSTKAESGSPEPCAGEIGASPFAQPVPTGQLVAQASRESVQLPEPMQGLIAEAIARETSGAWKLSGASREAERVQLRIQCGEEDLNVEFGPTHGAHVAAFLVLDGVAFAYSKSSDAMSPSDLRRLDAVFRKLRSLVRLTAAPR